MSFMHGSENLPILFENEEIVVYKNPSSEIFVQTKDEIPVQIRVSVQGSSLLVLPGHSHEQMVPACFNNIAGIRVKK